MEGSVSVQINYIQKAKKHTGIRNTAWYQYRTYSTVVSMCTKKVPSILPISKTGICKKYGILPDGPLCVG